MKKKKEQFVFTHRFDGLYQSQLGIFENCKKFANEIRTEFGFTSVKPDLKTVENSWDIEERNDEFNTVEFVFEIAFNAYAPLDEKFHLHFKKFTDTL